MTRDEWLRVQPILTRVLDLPDEARGPLLDTANLGEALRRDLMVLLSRGVVGSARATVAAVPPSTPPFTPPAPAGPPARRLPALTPGGTLANGRYVVVRQIGRGGMGTVFLGHDTTFATLVALKVMPYDERLLAEAQRAAVCSEHPHVATIHNVLKEEIDGLEAGVLVMEYVAGTPANRLLDDGPIDVGRVLKWGRQVASAVAHAHDHQVLHCDLKPANIMITADGRAKVLDFGISRATFDPGDPAEPLRGTLGYMAPEQLLDKRYMPAGDIYSLGVTLFELATGRRPFDAENEMLQVQILAAPLPSARDLVADIPAEFQDVLERAMDKDPEKRFRSARAFERALDLVEVGLHSAKETVAVTGSASAAAPSLWSKVAVGLLVVLSALLAFTMLGAYTSAIYNHTLERAGFANESIFDWLGWGIRASTGPLSMLLVAGLVWGVVRLVWRLAVRVFDAHGRRRASVGDSYSRVTRWLGLDEVKARAVAALSVSVLTLAIAVFWYRDLIAAFVSFAATSAPEQLARLSPEYVAEHNAFRRTFSVAVIVSVAAWYPVLKTPARRHGAPRGLVAGGVVTLLVALLLLHHPHRLMFSEIAGHGVEVVRWQERDCYGLGQRGSDTLLLCPGFQPPVETRHRIVRTGDPGIQSKGIRESVFRGFYRLAERNRAQISAR